MVTNKIEIPNPRDCMGYCTRTLNRHKDLQSAKRNLLQQKRVLEATPISFSVSKMVQKHVEGDVMGYIPTSFEDLNSIQLDGITVYFQPAYPPGHPNRHTSKMWRFYLAHTGDGPDNCFDWRDSKECEVFALAPGD